MSAPASVAHACTSRLREAISIEEIDGCRCVSSSLSCVVACPVLRRHPVTSFVHAWLLQVDRYRQAHTGEANLRYDLQRDAVSRYVAYLKEEGRAFPLGTHTVSIEAPQQDNRTRMRVAPSKRFAGLQGAFLDTRGTSNCPYGGWILLDADYEKMPIVVSTAVEGLKFDGSAYVIVGDPTSAAAQMNHVLASDANASLVINHRALDATERKVLDSFASIKIGTKVKAGDEVLLNYCRGHSYFTSAPVSCDWCLLKDDAIEGEEFVVCASTHCFRKRGYHRRCWNKKHETSMDPPEVTQCEFCDAQARNWKQESQCQDAPSDSRNPALVRQRRNLIDFVAQEPRYHYLKYHPWSRRFDAKYPTLAVSQVDLRPSQVFPGLTGVFPKGNACLPHTLVTYYPGALMWKELHNAFSHDFHCPTAVAVPVLDYTVDDAVARLLGLNEEISYDEATNGWTVHMVLVGDPVAPGPNVNSPRDSSAAANCRLLSCPKSQIHRYLTDVKSTTGDKKIGVYADIIAVRRNDVAIPAPASGTELLMSYDTSDGGEVQVGRIPPHGHDAFWERIAGDDEGFCDVCFGKLGSESNQLLLCSHESCSTGRHYRCFEAANYLRDAKDWYCPVHAVGRPLPSLHPSAAQGSSAVATPPPQTNSPAPARPMPFYGSSSAVATPPPDAAGSDCITNYMRHSSSMRQPSMSRGLPPLAPSKIDSRLSATAIAGARTGSKRMQQMKQALAPAQSATEPVAGSRDPDEQRVIEWKERVGRGRDRTPFNEPVSDGSLYDPDSDDDDITVVMTDGPAAGDVAPAVETALPVRRKSMIPLKIRSSSVLATSMSERLLIDTRAAEAVWHDFQGHLRQLCGDKTWWLRSLPASPPPTQAQQDEYRARAAKVHAKLTEQWNIVRVCCGAKDMQSPAAFLRFQLNFQKGLMFSRERLRQYIKQSILLRSTLIANNQEFCHTCFLKVADLCRSTLFKCKKEAEAEQAQEKAEANENLVAIVKRERDKKKGPKQDSTLVEVAGWIMSMVADQSQVLPTSDGSGDGAALNHRVLPFTTVTATIEALKTYVTDKWKLQTPVISPTTFNRARQYLLDHHQLSINISKYKGLARCKICERLTNEISVHRKTGDAARRALTEAQFKQHTAEWTEQRDYFNSMKRIALKTPWELHVLTLDGMDTAKTNMPHFKRLSKDSAVESPLPIRVVGAFNYGSPIVCSAITSLDDVPAKGANASVTSIETFLDNTFEAMDPTLVADIPAGEPGAFKFAPALSVPERPGPPAAPLPAGPLLPFLWPEGMHFTFDNAGSDCKNSTTFQFFCRLVAAGVFKYISVSTLLVGHTHDIVDQMFSVWSRALKHNDAVTIDELHELLRGKYASSIYELEVLKKQTEIVQTALAQATQDEREVKSEPAAAAAGGPGMVTVSDGDDEEETRRKQHSGVGAYASCENLAQRLVDLSTRPGALNPHVQRQTIVANVDAWVGGRDANIPDISKPHCFLIATERDIKDNQEYVHMYTRHLAESATSTRLESGVFNDSSIPQGVPFGPWTARKCMMAVRDTPTDDPLRVPAQVVDTANARKCIEAHKREFALNPGQDAAYEAMLVQLEVGSKGLNAACETCGKLMQQLRDIGVIHQSRDASPEEKARSRVQESNKARVKAELEKHLRDATYEAVHDKALRMHGWWTKWLERVRKVIRPYYASRGLIEKPLTVDEMASSGRTPHPARLVMDKHSAPLFRTNVANDCIGKHGLPMIGDVVACRSNDIAMPIWIAVIEKIVIIDEEGNEQDSTETQAAAAAAHESSSTSALAAPAATTAEPMEIDEDPLVSSVAAPQENKGQKRRRTARTTVPLAAAVTAGAGRAADAVVPVAAAASAASSVAAAGSQAKAGGRMTRSKVAATIPTAAAAAASSSSASSVAACARAAAAAFIEGDDGDSDDSDDPHFDECASDSSSIAASDPRPPSKKQRTFGTALSVSKPRERNQTPTAEALRQFREGIIRYKIRWFEFVKDRVVKGLKLDSRSAIRQRMEAAAKARPACLTEWDYAERQWDNDQFCLLPVEFVQPIEKVKFARIFKRDIDHLSPDQLVWWGFESQMLTANGRLTRAAFGKIKLDLCETRDKENNMTDITHTQCHDAAAAPASSATAAAPAAAAAAR